MPELTVPLVDGTNSPAVARNAVSEFLRREGRSGITADVVLVVSELATNAVLHGRPPMELHVTCTRGRLRVEVEDAAPLDDAPRPSAAIPDTFATQGRGLDIVAAFSHETGVTHRAGGKSVWAEWELP